MRTLRLFLYRKRLFGMSTLTYFLYRHGGGLVDSREYMYSQDIHFKTTTSTRRISFRIPDKARAIHHLIATPSILISLAQAKLTTPISLEESRHPGVQIVPEP